MLTTRGFGCRGRGRRDTESRDGIAVEHLKSRRLPEAYQSSGVGAVNTEQRDRGLDFLGRGGIGAQAVHGRAGHGELLGGTQAGAGDTSGHHRGDVGENLGWGEEES